MTRAKHPIDVNSFVSIGREWLFYSLTMVAAVGLDFSSMASEYEVDGNVNQTMLEFNGAKLHATASFTVFVRDCGWLIQTMETNEIGGVSRREIGSTNGTEIYEYEQPLGKVQATHKINKCPIIFAAIEKHFFKSEVWLCRHGAWQCSSRGDRQRSCWPSLADVRVAVLLARLEYGSINPGL